MAFGNRDAIGKSYNSSMLKQKMSVFWNRLSRAFYIQNLQFENFALFNFVTLFLKLLYGLSQVEISAKL